MNILFRHIEEDLKEYQLPHEKKVEDLSDDERGYLYFKVHDLDGNDKLDGLEIFYSATHHSHSKQVHDHSHEHENGLEHKTDDEANDKPEDAEQNEVNPKPQSNESDPGTDLNIPNMNLLKFDNEQLIDDSFNHVVGTYIYLYPPYSPTQVYLIIEMMLLRLNLAEVLDSFLSLADLNNDGYLNYAEYAAAIKIGEAMKEDGPKAEL